MVAHNYLKQESLQHTILGPFSPQDMKHLKLDISPGTQLTNIYVKCAFRVISVHPDDRPLLGML